MTTWMRRVRGALGMGLCWAALWGLVGGFLMEGIFDRRGDIVDMWPQVLGIAGFLGGVLFSLLVSLAGRRRGLDAFSLAEFAGLGAIAGVLLGGIGVFTGGPLLFLVFAPLGAAAAGVTTLGLARAADRVLGRGDGAKALPGDNARRLGVVLVLIATPLSAQVPLDAIATGPLERGQAVGLVAMVTRGDDTLLHVAHGKADAEWDIPMVIDAVFEAGSITKQFTAAAILKLRDDGKLSLDDDITRWLPDFDTKGHTVPLRRLLDHTSGMHDFTETVEFPSLVSNRVWPRDSAYALIKRQPFDFAPGERQQYSNSGFWLLGLVVEKASGMSYEEYLESQFFAPLGMTRSMYCNWSELVPRRARGHGIQNGQVYRGPTNIHTWSFGAGGVCSTAADLVTWLRALHGGRVLSAASYAEMTTPSRLPNGMTLRYGYGVGVERDPEGRVVINHGGISAGFRSEALWYPETKTAIVILMNATGGIDPEVVARMMAHALMPGRQLPAFTGDVAPLLGRYVGPTLRGMMTVDVTRDAEGLKISGNGSPPRPLDWIEGNTFHFGEIYVQFGARGTDGTVREIGLNPAKGALFVLTRQ